MTTRCWCNNYHVTKLIALVFTLVATVDDASAAVNYLPASSRIYHLDMMMSSSDAGPFVSFRRRTSYPSRNNNKCDSQVMFTSSSVMESSSMQGGASSSEGGGNPLQQMMNFVVESFQRFITGTKMLYSNHQTCNAIRAKQKLGGSISFQEFEFLRKGKEDRSKLGNILFLMVFSSSMLPYALMFFPDMIPSPFQPFDKIFTKYETLSRTRAHAVIETLLAMENAAINAPISSKFNPFSGGAVKREMERITGINNSAGLLFSSQTFDEVLDKIGDSLYFASSDSDKERNQKSKLMTVPKPIVKGIGKSLGLSSFLPNFMLRGKIMEHLKVLSESDEFLTKGNVDLDTLSRETLLDACGIRFIGSPRSSDDELRKRLAQWLTCTTRVQSKSDLVYNQNVGLISLLCFNAVQAIKDPNCESALPRLMFTAGPKIPFGLQENNYSPEGSLGMSQ